MWRAMGLLMVAVLLGGCPLIDQRTFERRGEGPGAGQVARSARLAAARAAPLVTVFPADQSHDWRPDVLAAVRDALVRDQAAEFDIITPIPTARPPEVQHAAAATGAEDAQAVATAIEADSVPAERLHLGARGDAGNPPRMVMVYLR